MLVIGAGQRSIPEENPPIGNGRAISVLFAREGASVACVDINAEAAQGTVDQVTKEGGQAFAEVLPGLMDTPMGRDAWRRGQRRAAAVPFGRQGTGWEVAYATLHLISHKSSYVNGHALLIDGGLEHRRRARAVSPVQNGSHPLLASRPAETPMKMKAAVQAGAEGLRIQEFDAPRPGVDDVLVRVRACGLNRADVGMAAGHMHGSIGGPGAVLGMEWAGEVIEVGAGVQDIQPGDRVMGSGRAAFAEYAVADQGRVMPLPSSAMSFEQAATLPIALQTMHDAIVTNGRLAAGDAVLIQGASSGVGLMGLQIARLMGAGLVIGTSTTPERRARLKDFGAQLALDSRDETWPQQVLDATGGKGVNLIVDQLSGAQANQNMRAAAVQARIVNVGRLAGTRAEFDFDLHALKRIHYIGVTFRTRSQQEVRDVNTRMRADLGDALTAGRLALPIDRVFAFDEAAQALAYMARNAHFGKVVLSLPT